MTEEEEQAMYVWTLFFIYTWLSLTAQGIKTALNTWILT